MIFFLLSGVSVASEAAAVHHQWHFILSECNEAMRSAKKAVSQTRERPHGDRGPWNVATTAAVLYEKRKQSAKITSESWLCTDRYGQPQRDNLLRFFRGHKSEPVTQASDINFAFNARVHLYRRNSGVSSNRTRHKRGKISN